MKQETEKRYVNHLLYAVTKLRGCVKVIEDALVTVDTSVSLHLPEKTKRVYSAPENRDNSFIYKNDRLFYTVERFVLHEMVVIDV